MADLCQLSVSLITSTRGSAPACHEQALWPLGQYRSVFHRLCSAFPPPLGMPSTTQIVFHVVYTKLMSGTYPIGFRPATAEHQRTEIAPREQKSSRIARLYLIFGAIFASRLLHTHSEGRTMCASLINSIRRWKICHDLQDYDNRVPHAQSATGARDRIDYEYLHTVFSRAGYSTVKWLNS
ncbi:uncharacterized protein EI90DRAFT_2270312 [Cantharellus anzutake]|uniref:uncharacterized protein n=1 Tax=Cantharellus anzutake TaxID=1750568 RepID=UPI001908FBCE|nr:uncharacterized protein EI90DRAFT_2270312 [Cantharellus anzutake]KAF8339688.1 hypothetical protein EI90DRAFT_2270312 [Cantharellus anzutake]